MYIYIMYIHMEFMCIHIIVTYFQLSIFQNKIPLAVQTLHRDSACWNLRS